MGRRPPELMLLDGTALLFQAYFSGHQHQTPGGLEIGGVALAARRLAQLLAHRRPAHVALVFDAGHRTFRHAITADYKGQRPPAPADLRPQFDLMRAVSVQLGLACFCVRGFEADDLMATLVEHGRALGFRCHMISADKDLHQLVRDGYPTVTQEELRSRTRYTEATVQRRLGVGPRQVVDFLSLVGDACDNIPGVRGIGPKTAAALLQHFGSLDALYDNLDTIPELPLRGARTLPDKLRAGHHLALQARTLVTLRRDVELGIAPQDIPEITRWHGPRARSADDLFSLLGLSGTLDRLRRELGYGRAPAALAHAS